MAMSRPDLAPKAPHIVAVELMPKFPSVVRLTDVNGATFHYRMTDSGELELGRPYIATSANGGYTVTMFWPALPGWPPSVLKVEENGRQSQPGIS